jgi:hypothetical protein
MPVTPVASSLCVAVDAAFFGFLSIFERRLFFPPPNVCSGVKCSPLHCFAFAFLLPLGGLMGRPITLALKVAPSLPKSAPAAHPVPFFPVLSSGFLRFCSCWLVPRFTNRISRHSPYLPVGLFSLSLSPRLINYRRCRQASNHSAYPPPPPSLLCLPFVECRTGVDVTGFPI